MNVLLSENKRSGAPMVIDGGMGECAYTVNGKGAGVYALEPWLARAWVFSTSS